MRRWGARYRAGWTSEVVGPNYRYKCREHVDSERGEDREEFIRRMSILLSGRVTCFSVWTPGQFGEPLLVEVTARPAKPVGPENVEVREGKQPVSPPGRRRSWFSLLALVLIAHPAAACPKLPLTTWPNWGVIEYAGCSPDPTVFELHHALNAPRPAEPPWTTGEWGTYYTRPDGHYEVVGWFDDAPAVDECGEESWHGRGGEAIPVVCGETWGVRSFPLCDAAVSGDELCPNGWYFLEPDVFHLSVRMLPDADVNRDGVVGSADALRVLACFGAPWQCDPEADTDTDGVIGSADWLAVRRHFGRRVESFTHLGHVQRYYADLAPCRAGERCYGYGDVHVWVEEQR